MIDCIYKPKGSRIWRWKHRLRPEDGRIEDISLRTSDKQVAEKRRVELLREKEHERAGFIPPKASREAAQRSLTEHLGDFLSDLRRRGKSDKYLANLKHRTGKLILDCGWKTCRDVTPDSFQQWRCRQEISAKTVNDYLEAVRCLFNWLMRNGRIGSNPLQTVEKVETKGRETRLRRALTDDEMKRLLAAVPTERKALYLLAVQTGLRAGELAALRWDDVKLNAVVPFIQVRASTTKNGKAATIRLHPETAAALEAHRRTGGGESDAVFSRTPRIERYRRDLKLAGITYRDEQGRFGDFHSLRKTFGTNLARGGVPSRVAMSLMRLSDRRLTDIIYTDENMLGTWSAIEALPCFSTEPSQGASQIASQKLVATGHGLSQAGTISGGLEASKTPVNIGEMSLSDTQCHNVSQQGKWREWRGLNP